ncbi:MAG TPA: helix-hairpin-helix domain-containing protein [Candidatus Paceibacterota bacterium]|nr:helix-hairpin-helix domain-containing protein [Candidatus Paceibacterota bacterium]
MRMLAPLILAAFLAPALALAADLININTADEATLESLPGIGSTKAEAIIAYRGAHGDFAAIADIQNVSGIGPSTYGEIKGLITVGAGQEESGESAQDDAASSTSPAATASQEKALPVYVDGGGERTVVAGAETAYTANVYDASGEAYAAPAVRWAFGDGSTAEGASVMKSYALPGTYLVSVSAVAESSSGEDSFIVRAQAPLVALTNSSAAGITVENTDAEAPLDLSRWQLSAGGALFTFPAGTKLAPGASVTFAPAVTGLAAAEAAELLFPSGALAASYATAPPAAAPGPRSPGGAVQPSAPPARSQEVQTVESASTQSPAPAHAAETALAPATTSELAAAGAALAALPPPAAGGGSPLSGALKLARSPWALGALSVLAFSAAAFMVL